MLFQPTLLLAKALAIPALIYNPSMSLVCFIVYKSECPANAFVAQNSVEVVVSRWNGPGVPTTDVIAWAGEPYGSEAAIGKWLVVKPKGRASLISSVLI